MTCRALRYWRRWSASTRAAHLANGRLQPGKTTCAMVGRIIGYPVEIVIPKNASTERKKRLLAHGAQLIYTDALNGYDEALREVHRRHDANADAQGLGRRLKAHDPIIRLICVLPEVFSGIEGLKPLGPGISSPRSWTRRSSTNGSRSQVRTPTTCAPR